MKELNNTIITICYGKAHIYNSINEAKQFFLECISASEGSEHDRYISIYQDLERGFNLWADNEFYENLEFGKLKLIDEKRHSDLKRYIVNNLDNNCKIYRDKILNAKFSIINTSINQTINRKNLERKLLFVRIKKWMLENLEDITEIQNILGIEYNKRIKDLETDVVDSIIVKGLKYINDNIKNEEKEYIFKQQLKMNFILLREYKIDKIISKTKEMEEEEQCED